MADDVDVSIAIERCQGAAAGEVAERVLRALPEWFGLDEPLRAYVHDGSTLQTLVARATRGAVGFLTFKPQTVAAAEIIVMGVLPDWHRCGIGRSLVAAAEDMARSDGARLLQVKTLGPSKPSVEYARTRAFYEARGFLPLEETTAFWGDANPCLVMVKPLL